MGDSSSHQYIHMVHHLIEECLVFNMSKEECMEALFKHANIQPVISSTVWKGLEKENKEFFEAYNKSREDGSSSTITESQIEITRQGIHKMMLDSSKDTNDNQNT